MLHIVFVLGLLALGAFKTVKFTEENNLSLRPIPGVIAAIASIVYLSVVPPSFGIVEAGHRGVVLQWGAVTGIVVSEGLYIVAPVIQTVEAMNVQTQAYGAKVEAASHDLQTIQTDVVLNYHLDPIEVAAVYRDLRREYRTRILDPAIQEVVKATTARYQAEALITERPKVKGDMETHLRERVSSYGIVIESVNITNFDFSREFKAAIEAKVVAEQNILVEENKLRQVQVTAQRQVTEARAAADATRAKAQGDADATRLRAEAEAQAIQQRGDALARNQRLVELEAVQRWDGKLPQYSLGGAVPFITLPQAAR